MPVKIVKEKGFDIEVGEEIYHCKNIPEQDISILRSMLGTVNDDGDYQTDPKEFAKFCYRVAHKVITGWDEVVDEDTGEEIKFHRGYIKGITYITIIDFGQQWISLVMEAEVQDIEEVKNSEPTSLSEETSRISRDVGVAESNTDE